MNTTSTAASHIASDMLAVFDSIPLGREEQISPCDREFCAQQEQLLYETLDSIDHWYAVFHQDAQTYRDRYRLSFQADGSVSASRETPSSLPNPYGEYAFKPFDLINQLVEKRLSAIERFTQVISDYFNRTYNISAPCPPIDRENIPMGFRPSYTSHVEAVMRHTEGRGFRQTAEEEIRYRFQETVFPGRRSKKQPELKGDKIVFHNVLCFDEFYFAYNKNHLHYNYTVYLENFCAAIALSAGGSLDGSTAMVTGLDTGNINLSDWYPLSTGGTKGMKFYKNGRIDVRFGSQGVAQRCFNKLVLETLIQNKAR